jgi:cell division protein FtsI (penicillin-binding protein 3)
MYLMQGVTPDSVARAQAERRIGWLALVILAWGAAILVRLLLLQVVHHGEYVERARKSQEIDRQIPAPRGSIFDRNGRLLAMSTPMDSVFINPLKLSDLAVASDILASILHVDRADLYDRMRRAVERRQGFLWVARRISPEESERLRGLRLDWIGFQRESRRHYPKDEVAGHVLGSVDHQESGNGGIEQYLNDVLRGEPGSERLLTDVKRRGIASYPESQARAGESLTLTIHQRIQFVAEQELARAVMAARGKTGSVVVLNPTTGDILALASYPTFDPNKPPERRQNPAARFNHAVSVPFEPGSVFKIITYSSAIESRKLQPDTIINCGNGAITLFGRTIHEAHNRGYGLLPAVLAFAKSSNIGAIQVGMKIGQENFLKYVRLFGFGQRTGVPLPAESKGKVRARWGSTSLASVAMGHEISTTTLQLARAGAVIANGGMLVKPRLILRRGDTPVSAEPAARILRPETAILMRRMMEQVVINPAGTGRAARLQGYTCGGKTGSAQIYDVTAHRFTHLYNASFVGFAPLANPAIVVVVTVNGTHLFGGAASAPPFKAIAEEALRVLNVPKDLPPLADDEERNVPADMDDAAIADLGTGWPTVLEEEAAENAAETQVAKAAPSAPAPPTGPTVPDFQGKTMRAVLEEASAKGLEVLLDGSGVARVQQPAPGSALHPGEQIRVQFAR